MMHVPYLQLLTFMMLLYYKAGTFSSSRNTYLLTALLMKNYTNSKVRAALPDLLL